MENTTTTHHMVDDNFEALRQKGVASSNELDRWVTTRTWNSITNVFDVTTSDGSLWSWVNGMYHRMVCL